MGCCTSNTQRKNANDPIQARPPPNSELQKDGSPGVPDKKTDGPVEPASHHNLIEPIPVPQSPVKEAQVQKHETPVSNARESMHRIPSPIKSVPINTCCYIFGIDADNTKKIFKFDPKTESFSPMNIPPNLEVYNMSACTYISETCIYISGGIDPHTGKISNRAFLYNPEKNTAEELPHFTFERYTHQTVVFKDHLYVLGGLGHDKAEGGEEQENVLKSVEKYNIKTKTWTKVSDLYFGRSLATVIVYQDTLYMLGGYIGGTKRTRTIEKLNPQTNQWEIIPYKLPRGLESSYVFSPSPDQLQFIGGQDASGSVSINYAYSLLEDSYLPKKPMIHPRVLHKGFLYNEKIYIFGGDDNDTMEEYNIQEDEWVKQPSAVKSLTNGIKLFSYSQPALEVAHEAVAVQQDASPDNVKTKKCFIFGDNDNSFILEVNFGKNMVKERSIPTNLKLFGYQGAALLSDGTYLLCGGINKHTKTISTKAYIYNPRNNSAKKLPKCFDARYTFNLVAMDNYVYAIGGRSWEEDSEAILNNCERFNIAKNQWEKIAKLNYPRCSAMAFRLKNKIFVLGGYKGNTQRWANIEVYHPEQNLWEALKIELKVALEGSSLVMANQRGDVFLLGGRTDKGDTDKIWEFDVEQGDMWEVGNLKEAKSLSKVYEFSERKVLILGGEKVMAEFFDLREGKTIEGNALVGQINSDLKRITNKGRNNDTKLWKFSLA